MSTAEQAQFDAIVAEVSSWPQERRIALIQQLYGHGTKLKDVAASWPPPRGISGKEFAELVDYQGPPLSDEDLKRMRDEALMEKYG